MRKRCSNESTAWQWDSTHISAAPPVLVSAGLFGLAHYVDQGQDGVEQAMNTGLVIGAIFAVTGRIWRLMCAHAAFDLTAVAIIYWNVESEVAHFVSSDRIARPRER